MESRLSNIRGSINPIYVLPIASWIIWSSGVKMNQGTFFKNVNVNVIFGVSSSRTDKVDMKVK